MAKMKNIVLNIAILVREERKRKRGWVGVGEKAKSPGQPCCTSIKDAVTVASASFAVVLLHLVEKMWGFFVLLFLGPIKSFFS